MSIGAIITVPGCKRTGHDQTGSAPGSVFQTPIASWQLFGRSILDHTAEQFYQGGVDVITVISEEAAHSAESTFWSEWDGVAARYLNEGIEKVLLVRLSNYVEIDVPHLARMHQQANSPLTQVYHNQQPLDIVLVEGRGPKGNADSFRSRLNSIVPRQCRYRFAGYYKPLSGPKEFRELAQDSLLRRTRIVPKGKEVRRGVWLADGARVDASAQIKAPACVGEGARIAASCSIAGASTIERNSEVDCGTSIDGCCLFPGTYVGMGLRFRRAIVASSGLFHLERDLEVEIQDSRLLAVARGAKGMQSGSLVRRAKSLLASRSGVTGSVSTNSLQPASLFATRRFGRYG